MADSSYHSGATVTDLTAYRAARRPDPTPTPPAAAGSVVQLGDYRDPVSARLAECSRALDLANAAVEAQREPISLRNYRRGRLTDVQRAAEDSRELAARIRSRCGVAIAEDTICEPAEDVLDAIERRCTERIARLTSLAAEARADAAAAFERAERVRALINPAGRAKAQRNGDAA